jgi:hypothetical protein
MDNKIPMRQVLNMVVISFVKLEKKRLRYELNTPKETIKITEITMEKWK